GWFLMMTAFTPRQQRTAKTFLSFAAAGAIATVVSFAFQRVLLPWHCRSSVSGSACVAAACGDSHPAHPADANDQPARAERQRRPRQRQRGKAKPVVDESSNRRAAQQARAPCHVVETIGHAERSDAGGGCRFAHVRERRSDYHRNGRGGDH